MNNLEQEEEIDLMQTRIAQNIPDNKKMMIAVAWIHEQDRHYFGLYPEVVMMDVTENTNTERRPMFLVVGKDANSKTFVVMRVLMPHQKGWIFKWIFNFCFPKLLGSSNCRLIKLCITDGDRNIIDHIKHLMRPGNLFSNAK